MKKENAIEIEMYHDEKSETIVLLNERIGSAEVNGIKIEIFNNYQHSIVVKIEDKYYKADMQQVVDKAFEIHTRKQ